MTHRSIDPLTDAARWALCRDAGGAGKGGCNDDCACLREAKVVMNAIGPEIERLRSEATATVASIRTRIGQIEKACSTWNADSIYKIEAAVGALRIAALDLHNALNGAGQSPLGGSDGG